MANLFKKLMAFIRTPPSTPMISVTPSVTPSITPNNTPHWTPAQHSKSGSGFAENLHDWNHPSTGRTSFGTDDDTELPFTD